MNSHLQFVFTFFLSSLRNIIQNDAHLCKMSLFIDSFDNLFCCFNRLSIVTFRFCIDLFNHGIVLNGHRERKEGRERGGEKKGSPVPKTNKDEILKKKW